MKTSNLKAGKTASANSVNSKELSKVYSETYKVLSKDAKQLAKSFNFQAKSFLVLIAPTNVWWRKSLQCKFEKNEKIDSKISKMLDLAKQNATFVDKDNNICSIKYLYHETETYPDGKPMKIGYKYIIKQSFTLAAILQLLYKPAKVQKTVTVDEIFNFVVDNDSTITVKSEKTKKTDKADKKATKKAPAKVTKKAPAKKAPAKKADKAKK